MKVGPQADKFGAFLMTNVRDAAIDRFDSLATNQLKSPRTESLRKALGRMSAEDLAVVRRCVFACVDTGLHDFLFALQQVADFDDDIHVVVDGNNIVEQSDGLHGELFGDNGWFARYSKHGQNPDNA
jgi:hypothetical protein